MQEFTTPQELMTAENNVIIGAEHLTMRDSSITFYGVNNVLYIEEDVTLEDCCICFKGINSIVYLSANPKHVYRIDVTLYNHCAFFSGKDNYFNDVLKITLSEQKHMLIGSGCLFAFDIYVRTADPHLVYDAATSRRINPSKSVYIGDHVWIGQNVLLLKGTQVASGSIVGAGSVLAGKRVPSNTSFAGNPAKQIAKEIFWDEPCVHAWTDKDTASMEASEKTDLYVYEHNGERVSFDYIDKRLSEVKTAWEKLKYLRVIALNDKKNRFAFCPPPKPEPAPKGFKQKWKKWLKQQLLKILK